MSTPSVSRSLAGLRPRSRGDVAVLAVIVLGVPVLVGAFIPGSTSVRIGIVAALLALVAGWITTVHPRITLGAFAFVLGFAPYAKLPGLEAPLVLVLGVGIWVALAFLPGVRLRPGWPEAVLGVVAVVALVSVLVTDPSPRALLEYAAWLVATAVVVPVRHLTAAGRRVVVRTFVAGAAAASLIGIVLLRIDPDGRLLARLSVVGYRPEGGNAQFVHGVEGESLRLTGTFVEPNIAGLVLAVALLLALATSRGALRAVLVTVIGLALALTLSRSALGTALVAIGLVALVARGRQRGFVVAAGVGAAVLLLAVPVLRERLLTSFTPYDTGSTARGQALGGFADAVAGHWWWGLGWDRMEFRDTAVAWKVNVVANAPLLTLYRGGLVLAGVTGLGLVALVLRLLVVDRGRFEEVVLACGVAAFCLVALQLDYPVVTQAPATAVFSLLIGLSLARRSGDGP